MRLGGLLGDDARQPVSDRAGRQHINAGQHAGNAGHIEAGNLRHRHRVNKQFGKAHQRQSGHHHAHRCLPLRRAVACIKRQQHKAAAHQHQAKGELQPYAQRRANGTFRTHQPRQYDARRHHRHGVNRLEERGRHFNIQQAAVHKVVDEQANRAPALLRQNPEQGTGQHQQNDLPQRAAMFRGFDHNADYHLGGEHANYRQQIAGPVIFQQQRKEHRRNAEHHHQPAPGRQHKLHRPQRLFIDAAGITEVAATAEEDHQADKHADPRQRKADMPTVPLRRQPAGDGRGDGADVTGGVQQ